MGKQFRKAAHMALQVKQETEWTKMVTQCAPALHALPGPTKWSPYELYMGRKPPVLGLLAAFHEETREITAFVRERQECHKRAEAAVTKLRDLAAKACNQLEAKHASTPRVITCGKGYIGEDHIKWSIASAGRYTSWRAEEDKKRRRSECMSQSCIHL